MTELRMSSRPHLDRPVLIAAFRGWNDGGQGASLAGAYLARAWAGQEFASIDPENFYDFQATRPMVSLVDGYTRQIDWPENTFMHAPLPGAGRDAIILLGVEPNLRWRTFSELITGVAMDFKVELVITLGSLLADVPHTRPSPVTGSATDPELIDQLGLQASRYEGPTGMVGVLHDACASAGLKSASLWAAVPHYVSLTPSPRAAKALVDRLGSCSAPTSTPLSSTRPPTRTRSRSARRSRPTRRRPRTSRISNAGSTSSPTRPICRRATRSQPS